MACDSLRKPGKSKLDKYRDEIEFLLQNGSTKVFLARKYNTTRPNFYKWMGKNGLKTSAKEG